MKNGHLGHVATSWRPLLMAPAFALIVLLGWVAANWQAAQTERHMRDQLLYQARQIAATIDPELVKALTFTAADKGTPAFERLRAQLIAYSRYTRQRSIYTMALRGDHIVFGPESLAEDDPWASPPGTVYQQPSPHDFDLLRSGTPKTIGRWSDEYGTFMSALAPVIDPQNGRVLMGVGIDVDATEWNVLVERSRLLPNLITLAPLLIFPVALALLQWYERRVTHRSVSWPRHGETAMVLSLGLMLTGFGVLVVTESERHQRWLIFQHLAGSRTALVRDNLLGLRSDLASVARFHQGSEQVTRREFYMFTTPLLGRPGLQALGWVPRVLPEERAHYEALARQDGLEHFSISERSTQKDMSPALDRMEYYPIYYIEPLANNRKMLGFDLGADPSQRSAMEAAIRTGLVTATDPLVMTDGDTWQRSVTVYQPVLDGARETGTPAERIQGFIVGVVNLQPLLHKALSPYVSTERPDVQVSLVDLVSPEKPLLLASYPAESSMETQLATIDLLPSQMVTVHPVFVFGRTWAIVARPGEGFYAAYPARAGWLIGLAGLLLTGLSGAFVATQLRQQDVLEQQVRERTATLQETEERFRTLVQQVPAVVYLSLLDEVGTTLYISPQLSTMVGYTPEEWIAQPDLWQRCLHPDDRARVLAAYETMRTDGVPMNCEYRYVTRDGRIIWVHEVATILRARTGEPRLCQGILIDITEQKRAEEERLELERRLWHAQKLESLGVLAGGVAHDFNNLLTALQGHLEIAQQQVSHIANVRWHLDAALQVVRRATDLTRQMLAYAGKGQFVVQEIDLNALIEQNRTMLSAAVSRFASFDLQLAAQLPPVLADVGQIQQVIMNLVTNASEAIGEQPGVITLRTGVQVCDQEYLQRSCLEEKPPAGPYVFVEVSDTGCGMDECTRARMFEPFFTTKFAGRGLGMAAVQGIVRALHGAITVDSAPGRGTTVRILLPVAQSSELSAPAPSVPAAQTEAQEKTASTGTILVVDDEDMVCELVADALQLMGFQVLTANDGEAGVRLFQEHVAEIACVILDLTMPQQDGASIYHALRAIRPDVPIILTSGYSLQDVLQRLEGQRPDGFLHKPYPLEELRRVVESAIRRAG
ncbi:MAG: CHASE domain-containing protein [Anaerolineae bacterium]|nr:CHASE domain-containing protein [Anaerolineae bacterium]